MIAILYEPGSGKILQMTESAAANVEATAEYMGAALLELPARIEITEQHRVMNGALVLEGDA
jgi:hypothetical protein